MADDKKFSVNKLYKFFGKGGPNPTVAGFAEELKQLTDMEKQQLSDGIENGTLTY
jgi:hypothetical protein